MYIPNGFVSSSIIRKFMYDDEGRLRESRGDEARGTGSDGGIASTNSMFSTEAEDFGAIAPFLKANKAKDAKRRNYIIQPGGACVYFEDAQQLKDPFGGGRVQFTQPTENESFGHNSLDGSKLGDPNGRAFTVGSPGDQPRGMSR